MSEPLTYRQAGVDVAAGGAFAQAIGPLVRSTHTPAVVGHASRFAGLIRPDTTAMTDPLIAATCDGVGTKVLLARSDADLECLGRDLVAMNVNDLLPLGAQPILFLDYLATAKLDAERLTAVVRGIAAACVEAGCALLGGETAEMPDLYGPEGFEHHPDGFGSVPKDMAGFAVGIVDGSRLPDPAAIRPGDPIVGLPSTGVHSNGLSLARRALLDRGGLDLDDHPPSLESSLGATLMTPTAIYVAQVLALADAVGFRSAAHVTGGGLLGRAAQLAPDGLGVRIDPDAYARPSIFGVIAEAGDVSDAEMAATFNMGLGFLAVVAPEAVDGALPDEWTVVGEVTGEPGVDLGYVRR